MIKTQWGKDESSFIDMARSLWALSLFSRLGTPSVISSVNARFASKGVSKAWMGQSHVQADRGSNRTGYSDEMFNEELELEDVEDKLQALIQ